MDGQGKFDDRNPALDFTKGVLVLFMVLYHWINYFVGVQGAFYTYIRFVPSAFIFLAGFMIANIYPEKYGLGNFRLYVRLVVRGLKLLVLFTVLNVTANMFIEKSYNGTMPGINGLISNATTIYISGNAKVAFGVLVPIGYLLVLSAVVFLVIQMHKYSVHLLCAVLFLCVGFLDLYGIPNPNLTFIAVGILGMIFGFYPIEKINNWIGYPYVLVGLNVGYIGVISVYGVGYVIQVIGVCLSVALIYLAGVTSHACGELRNTIILLGKYSLFGYIAQIGLLQLLQRSLPLLNLNIWGLWIISFVGAFTLTIFIVRMAHYIRTRIHVANWLYRAVFS
jgi:peptidoglycan/LPS O-acetylase OafA/YrhL